MTGQAQQFIDALAQLETDDDVDTIAGLFAADADISNPMVAHHGEDGAATFWRSYRATFDTIHSEFRTIVEGDGVACLEWVSSGTIKGDTVRYGGVSMIEFGPGGLTAFRTYFDPAPFAGHIAARA